MARFFPAYFKDGGGGKWKITISWYLKILEGSKLREEIKHNL